MKQTLGEGLPCRLMALLFHLHGGVIRALHRVQPSFCDICLTRYAFGPASFLGLMGGNVLVMAGILKSMAFREIMKRRGEEHSMGKPGEVILNFSLAQQ